MTQLYDDFTRSYVTAKPPVIEDDRTPEEKAATIGFWVATDSFMSGWGGGLRRSLVACPCVSSEDCDKVETRFRRRSEFKRVRFVGRDYRPKLSDGDHLHIYDTKSSFRYAL